MDKNGHILYTDEDTEVPDVICDPQGSVALSLCKICGGAEGAMPTNCPGRPLTTEELDLIQIGELDF